MTILLQGTVICRSDRTALAVVEDVFGPVTAPMYLLRFASQAIMEELLVIPGLPVFYPQVLPCSLHFIQMVIVFCFTTLTRSVGPSISFEKRRFVSQGECSPYVFSP